MYINLFHRRISLSGWFPVDNLPLSDPLTSRVFSHQHTAFASRSWHAWDKSYWIAQWINTSGNEYLTAAFFPIHPWLNVLGKGHFLFFQGRNRQYFSSLVHVFLWNSERRSIVIVACIHKLWIIRLLSSFFHHYMCVLSTSVKHQCTNAFRRNTTNAPD